MSHSPTVPSTAPIELDPTGSGRTAARVAAAASVVFAVSFFMTVAAINVPHRAGAGSLVEWWQERANINSSLASLGFAALTAVSFVVVTNYVQSQVPQAASRGAWAAFARSVAGAFTTLLLVSAAIRGVFGHLVVLDDEPLPGADVLRYSTALNYTLMGTVVMGTCALTLLALAIVVRRSGILAGWHAVMGLGCGALMLLAALIGYGQYTVPLAIIWGLGTAVAIWRAAPSSASRSV